MKPRHWEKYSPGGGTGTGGTSLPPSDSALPDNGDDASEMVDDRGEVVDPGEVVDIGDTGAVGEVGVCR